MPLLLSVVALTAGCQSIHHDPALESKSGEYLTVVQQYADAMIEKGRDHCGPFHCALFASALDRDAFTLPSQLPPIEGIRKNDRSYTGGNPMHDENLYLLLYDLSAITDDPKYGREADSALRFFFTHAQSPATGLFAWGEHMYWDFQLETMGGNDTHEFYRPWVLLEESYRLAPKAMQAYAHGLWMHQIADQKEGYFSRHARWSDHKASRGAEFPRHAGFYIAQWAEAYRRTHDSLFLTAIETLVDYFERVRNAETGALPNVNPAGTPGGIKVVCWVESQLSMAIDLSTAAAAVPRPLRIKLLRTSKSNDDFFLCLPHDFGDAGKGFVATSDYFSQTESTPSAYCPTWASGYGIATNAQAAMTCYERYRQTKDQRYADLVVKAAALYLASEPDAAIELYPGPLGDAIFLMVSAFRLTGDPQYLDRACGFADQAIALFWDHGPLPRASSRTRHYETITRADTLARALLLLSAQLTGRKLDTLYVDR